MENNRPIQKYYDIVLKDIQKSKKIYNLTKKKFGRKNKPKPNLQLEAFLQ